MLELDITLPIPMFTQDVNWETRGVRISLSLLPHLRTHHHVVLKLWCAHESAKISIRPADVSKTRHVRSRKQNVTWKRRSRNGRSPTFSHLYLRLEHRSGPPSLPIMALYGSTVAITHATSSCTLLVPLHTAWQCDRRER
jgi:hypothetical protein